MFRVVIERLEAAKVEYMVVGSIASIIYGEPRLTAAMDLVVEIPLSLVARFEQMFPSPAYYTPPVEVIAQEVVNRRQFNVMDIQSGLKIDFIIRRADSHSIEEFSRRRRVSFLPGFDVFIAAPEDVILKKLLYFREGRSQKHLADIRSVLALTPLDSSYIARWVAALGLDREWAELEA